MAFTQVQKLQLNNQVDRILHAPGNFQGGNLEMTMVFDYDTDMDRLREDACEIVTTLKSHSPVFRNVRFNGVKWKGDLSITNQIVPMTFIQMGKFFDEKDCNVNDIEALGNENKDIKKLEILLQKLKMYHARSKLILILTDGKYQVSHKESAKSALNPFLKHKLLLIGAEGIQTGMELFMKYI